MRIGAKGIRTIVVVMMVMALVLISRAPVTAADVIELSYASPFGPDHTMSVADKIWMTKIEKDTNGRVKFKPYWSGSLVDIRNGSDEIRTGVADVGWIAPSYEKAGYEITKAMYTFSHGANQDIGRRVVMEVIAKFPEIEKEYAGLKVMAWTSGTDYQLLTNKKAVRKLDDLKGMRIKCVGELMDALKDLGAEGLAAPMTEVYMSMQKGVLDGAFVPPETLKSMSFAEVGKYYTIFDYYYTHTGTRAMSLKTWNKLPPDIQKIFENNIDWYGREQDKTLMDAHKVGYDYAKNFKIEIITLPKADLDKFYNAIVNTAVKQAKLLDAKGMPGTKIYTEMQRLIKLYKK
ncbi:MAG TPA: TRAP transporter substrate-binding protein DctP [Syntrophorhabdaceae bacterium]|nr:TRAP transporter substrate-binding protein DctP [Syntrophorhabdaceae bacterium]